MSLLKTCRPLKRCFPWKCSSQRAAEFRLLNASRNQTLFRRRSTPPLCRLLRRDTNARTITVTWRERERKNKPMSLQSANVYTFTSKKNTLQRSRHTHWIWRKEGGKKKNMTLRRLLFPNEKTVTRGCNSWRDGAAEFFFLQHLSRQGKLKHTGRETEVCLRFWNWSSTQ